MATTTTWFTLGLIGMVAGTALLAAGVRLVPVERRRSYAILVAIPGIAILGYAAMVVGIGTVGGGGHEVHLPRYADWLITTPLNVLFLGLLAGADRRTLGALVGLQSVTILAGLAGAVLASPASWVGFLFGSVAFAGVGYLLFVEVQMAARDRLSEGGFGVFQTLRNFVVVLWGVYPFIWILEPSGLGLMDAETTALVVAYLDVVTKVGFGLLALHGFAVVLDSADESTADDEPHSARTDEERPPTPDPG